MIFDKFKNIDMPDIDVEADVEYVEKLELIARQKHKKPIFSVIGTVAASLVVVVCVAVWAIIGSGVRNIKDDTVGTAAKSGEKTNKKTVIVGISDVFEQDSSKWEHEISINSELYFEFGGKDAKEIIDTLNSLEGFDENGLCHCAPNYNVSFDGKSFGLRLDDEAYARHDGGQISISSRVAYKLLDILERNIVLENRVYPEAEQNELMLTVRDQNTILRYVAKDKNTKLLLEFALKADYTEGDLPYDAEYKLGFEYKEPSRFALSLKGDAPFIASENGIYYLKADQTKALKDAIESISTKQNQIEAKQSYEEPYQARVAATAYPDGAEKYMFYNEDSDELLLLLESYFYQSVNGGCSCQPSVCITPTHLRNEHPRANSYIVAFCADSTHVYTDSGHRHAVVSYEDGERIKEILYKNCK